MKNAGPGWKHFVLLLAAFSFQLSAFGQEATSQLSTPTLSTSPDLVTGLIQSLAAKYPWLTSVVAFIGVFRLLAKPVCMWLERRAAETPDDTDDILIARLERSTAVKVLDFFLDLGLSVKRDVVVRAVAGKPVALLLLSTLILQLSTGCATWDGLSPNQQQALRAAAKLAVSFGVSQLGDSVKEVRPYQDALMGVINATFSAATDGKAIGNALSEGVQTVVKDPVLRAQVLAALKAQLAGATAAASGQRSAISGQQKFNAAIASKL